MPNKYEVIKEIPMGRFLYSFDYFPTIPVGTILSSNDHCIVYDDGKICGDICDIGSKLDEKHLQKYQVEEENK